MSRAGIVDCVEFYLWSIGELQLKHEPDFNELITNKEDQ